jgi:hypothetical protein
MTVSTDGTIPSLDSYRAQHAWKRGQALRINKGDPLWCTGCTAKIFIFAEEAGDYVVMAKTNLGVPNLKDGIHYDDIAYYGEQHCFRYKAFEPDTEIHLRVTEYSGSVRFYMNPKKAPVSWETAAFNPASYSDNQLIIFKADREVKGRSEVFYACVEADSTATYSLVI